MRQRIAIILTIVLVLGVLIAINVASYQGADERQDTELAPNRSTYHSGATGSRALYDFLSESGYRSCDGVRFPPVASGHQAESADVCDHRKKRALHRRR